MEEPTLTEPADTLCAEPLTISTEIALREALQVTLGAAGPPGQEHVDISRQLFTWLLRRALASLAPLGHSGVSPVPSAANQDAMTNYHVHLRGTFSKNGERVL